MILFTIQSINSWFVYNFKLQITWNLNIIDNVDGIRREWNPTVGLLKYRSNGKLLNGVKVTPNVAWI